MNKCKKTVVMILALLMMISTIPGYAATPRFKDVPASHWAYKDVEKMASLGYIAGKDGGKFDPNGTLTYQEAMLLLARLTNPSSQERTIASNGYNALLNELKIASWAKEGIAVALFKDIITESELRDVSKKGLVTKPISKVDTGEYLVKAMGLEEVAKSKLAFSLPYKDVLDIEVSKMKYVSVLLDIDVFTKEGDGTGKFLPKSNLTRAVMAKMISTAYDYLEKNPTSPTEPSKPEPPKEPETEKIEGRVVRFSDVGQYKFLTVNSSPSGEKAYQLMNNTTVTIDGKSASYAQLTEGQDVELTLKKGTLEIISIKSESVEMTITGKVKSVNSTGNKLTVEYLENKKTVSKEFSVDTRAKIYKDGKSVYLRELKDGDLLELQVRNNVIEEIEATSKVKDIKGVIKEISPIKDSKDEEYNLTVVDEKDNSHKFLINAKTTVYRENRKVKPEDLKVKDEVRVKAEYDLEKNVYIAYDLDAFVVRKNIKGIIVEMQTRFQEATKLIIYNSETKKEESYTLGKNVYIRVDKTVSNSYDLKIGYYVEVVTEGDEITEIDANSSGMQSTVLGRILNISRAGRIELEVQNFAMDNSILGKEISVYTDNANIMDTNGIRISLEQLRRDDTINVIGNYDGSTFIAKTIMLMR